MSESRKILIVDDHPLMGQALRDLVGSLDTNTQPALTPSLAAALEVLAAGPVDLVVLDLQLGDSLGFDGLKQIRSAHPGIPVAVCSGTTDNRTVLDALEHGACGFIPKSFEADAMVIALRTILAGNVYVPPVDVRLLAEASRPAAILARPDRIEDLGLTHRQIQILRLILRGLPNKLIARELDIAEGTVKVHVSTLLARLNARNRTEAVLAVSHLDLGALLARASRPPPAPPTPEDAPRQ